MYRKLVVFIILLMFVSQFGCQKAEEKERIEIISGPEVMMKDSTTAEVGWETNVAGISIVYYGLTSDLGDTVIDEVDSEKHIVILADLIPDTDYYYIVESNSDYFSGLAQSDLSQFNTTYTDTGTSIELEITSTPIVEQTGPTRVEVSWDTNLPGISVVYYGLTNALGDTTKNEEDREHHEVLVTGLVQDTVYYFIVESSSNYFNGTPQSDLSQFNTTWTDTDTVVVGELEILSGPEVEQMGPTGVEISWETNFPGNSVVYYGITIALGDTAIDDEEREFHTITLIGLIPDTVYYFEVESNSDYFSGSPRSVQSQFATQANEESYTVLGWSYFSQEEYVDAVNSFNNGININSAYAPAYAGRGWTYFRMENYDSALEDFNLAVSYDITLLVTYVGRSLDYLRRHMYSEAISDGQVVLNADSTYQFEYETSINHILVRLVMAQAYYATQNYELAQEQCDILDPGNSLDPVLPDTWSVDGVQYDTYIEALLALIQSLVILYL